MYRLKQSLGIWFQRIDTFFVNDGFIRNEVDNSMYMMQPNEFILIVIVYADDLIILSNIMEKIDWLKIKLKKEYEMNNLKELYYYLGVEFEKDCNNKTITISQSKYIKEVLKQFKMEDYKSIGTSLEANLKLMKIMDEEFFYNWRWNERCSIQSNSRLTYVHNSWNKDGSYICNEYYKSTHMKNSTNSLNNYWEDYEVLERQFELQIVSLKR